MNKLTRRSLVKSIPACGLAAIVSAEALAMEYGPTDPRHPWNRARTHANALSEALAEADNGRWFAEIYPKGTEYAVRFGDIESYAEIRKSATSPTAPPQTEIETLFSEWLAVANGPQDPDEDDNWGESRYVRLQAAILAAEPVTPRDVAIQFFVDCDQFGSNSSEHFDALVTRLIGPIT